MERKLDANLIIEILAAGLMSFCGVVIETATNVAFPILMREFGVNLTTVQWLTTGYLLVSAIMMLLSVYLKRNFTAKTLFIIAATCFIFGLILDAGAQFFAMLICGRVIQGIAAGIAIPLMFNIILEQSPRNRLGLLMGVGTMVTAVAPALGPTFGGIVLDTLGWRFIFILVLPIMLLSFILGIISIHGKSPLPASVLDKFGLFSAALAFTGLILAFSNLAQIQSKPMYFIIPLLFGICALTYFIRHSLKSKIPLLNLHLLRNTQFTQGLSSFFLFQIIALGLSFVLPNYIQIVNGKSALITGLLVLPGGVIGALLAPVSGRILDRYGARKPIIAGAIAECLGLLLFAILGQQLTIYQIMLFYIFTMIGMGLSMGNSMTNALSKVNDDEHTDGNGFFNLVQQFAGAVGTAIVSTVMQFVQQNSHAASFAQRTATGAQVSLFVLAIVGLTGFYMMYQATKDNPDTQE